LGGAAWYEPHEVSARISFGAVCPFAAVRAEVETGMTMLLDDHSDQQSATLRIWPGGRCPALPWGVTRRPGAQRHDSRRVGRPMKITGYPEQDAHRRDENRNAIINRKPSPVEFHHRFP